MLCWLLMPALHTHHSHSVPYLPPHYSCLYIAFGLYMQCSKHPLAPALPSFFDSLYCTPHAVFSLRGRRQLLGVNIWPGAMKNRRAAAWRGEEERRCHSARLNAATRLDLWASPG